MHPPSPTASAPSVSVARRVAFEILRRVEGGSYASELLDSETRGMTSRDAGLTFELVFGVLRRRAQLDYLIRHYAGKGGRTDFEVRIALRIGLYQIHFLDHLPAHAAVAESVEIAKFAKGRFAAGFANAVLRKAKPGPVAWPDRPTRLSMPEWLLDRWDAKYGGAATDRIAHAFLEKPEKYFAGDRQQDISSQSIVPLLDLKRGHTFLDVCAAPGNKTLQAIEYGVHAIACDLHHHRIKQMEGCPRVQLDATQPLPFDWKFDRILVDAPCSGTGTIGRNPEIRWRIQPDDLEDLRRRQTLILRNSLAALAPGGVLVYSTCSLEPEEGEEVVYAVAREVVSTSKIRTLRRTPGTDPGDGFFAAVIPS